MKVGKLKKQKDLLVNQVNQNITEDLDSTSKNSTKKIRKQRAKKKIEQASPTEISELLQSLFAQVEGYAQYNQVADTSTYLSSDQDFSEEEIAALKFSNRKRTKALAEDLAKVAKQVDKKLEAVNHYYEYDNEIPELLTTAKILFGAQGVDEGPSRLTQKQVDELEQIIEQFSSMKADQQLAKFNKKANNKKKKEDLDVKYENLISKAISYETAKPAVSLVYQGYTSPPNPKLALVLNPMIWPNWPNKLAVIEDFDLHKDASSLHQNIKENKASLPEDFHPDVFLIPLKEQIKTLTQTTTSMGETLLAVDEQNSFVDRIFSGKEPIKIRKPGGIEESFDMDQLANCWDCFSSKWEDPEIKKDFDVDFKVEFQFNKLLNSLEAKWDKMKAALDIPYIVQQNYCSLMRLGSLCPTEILMLLAALTGMAIFTWEELFSNFSFGGLGGAVSGYLGLLFFNGFLKPILTSLDISGKFSIGPINYYAGCTVNSLVKLQDIDKYSGQYGIKTEEALGWLSNAFIDRTYTHEDAIRLLKDAKEYNKKIDETFKTKESQGQIVSMDDEAVYRNTSGEDRGAIEENKKYMDPYSWGFSSSDPIDKKKARKDKIEKTMAKSVAAMAPVKMSPEEESKGAIERWPPKKGGSSDHTFVENPPAGMTSKQTELEKASAMLEDSVSGKERFMNTLLNPLLQTGGLDVLEIFIGLIKDFAEKIKAQEGIISTALQGIEELFNGDSFGASTSLIAKLAGLGHLISVVKGLLDLAENGIEPCLKMPIETPDGIVYTNESPFRDEELRQMTGNKEKVYYGPSVITKQDGTATQLDQPYVYNPITDRRFNLTNCNAAKSSIISRGESLEFWKRVSLGKNVDNV